MSEARRCPKCREIKRFSEQDGGDFYVRTLYWTESDCGPDMVVRQRRTAHQVPSSYCRQCESKVRVERRDVQRAAKRLDEALHLTSGDTPEWTGREVPTESVCEVCRAEGLMFVSGPHFVCWGCRSLIDMGRQELGKILRALVVHNTREEAKPTWRGRAMHPHARNKFGPITDHGTCLEVTVRVKATLMWMILGSAA